MTNANEKFRFFHINNIKLPLKSAIAAGLLAALISLLMPNYYKSEVQLLPGDAGSSPGAAGITAAAAALGVNLGTTGSNDSNFSDILKSRWLEEKLLNSEFTYSQKIWRFGSERKYKNTLFNYLQQPNMDKAVKNLERENRLSNKDPKTKWICIVV